MKRLWLAGVGVAMAATAALGADVMPGRPLPPPRAPVTYVPFFTWNGAYVGLNAGYGWGDTSGTLFAAPGNFNVSGGLAGGQIGGNYQFNNIVLGVEADYQWADIDGS